MQTKSKPWWLDTPIPDQTTITLGLSSVEVKKRLEQYGQNIFRDKTQRAWLLQYLSRFKNPLVLILLATSTISAFTGEVTNFISISTMVLFSVTLDFVQEYRANATAATS